MEEEEEEEDEKRESKKKKREKKFVSLAGSIEAARGIVVVSILIIYDEA